MGQLLVFMGGSREIVTTTQRALWRSLDALARQRVLVPQAGRSSADPRQISHQLLLADDGGDVAWGRLHDEVESGDADTVLLVLPGLVQPRDSDERHRLLVDRLTAVASDVVLVTVVADQLTLMNDAYVALVGAWRTASRLAATVPQMLQSGLFDHEQLLRPWLGEEKLTCTAIPWQRLRRNDPVACLLDSIGVAYEPVGRTGEEDAPPLGPIAVEANRLLTAYLRGAMPDLSPADPAVLTVGATVAQRASRNGWSNTAFWGFDATLAGETIERFRAGNDRFARAVWDSDWMLGYPVDRACTAVDMLDLEPAVVEQIHRYVGNVTQTLTERLATSGTVR